MEVLFAFLNRQRALGPCLKEIVRKLNAKMIERQARSQHGSASFPEIEEAARQRLYKFDREVKFSILMPLYNNFPKTWTGMRWYCRKYPRFSPVSYTR